MSELSATVWATDPGARRSGETRKSHPAIDEPSGRDGGTTADAAESFRQLFERVLERAYATASYLTRDPTDAEDLVQEAALQAFTNFTTFEPGTNFKAWFLRILTNCFYMRYRRQRRCPPTVSFDDDPDLFLYSQTRAAGLHDGDAEPAKTFMDKLETEQIGDAIRSLPDEFRVVASLYFIEDLSYQEIAVIVNCPVGTVRSRLHRGRKLLQAALWRIAEDHGLVPIR